MTAVRDTPRDEELVASVERLAAIGSCSTPSFSPDGSRIAFLSDLSGTPQLWTMPSAGGWPERVTAFADQLTNARWSPAEDLIAIEDYEFLNAIARGESYEPGFDAALDVVAVQAALVRSWESGSWETVVPVLEAVP